MQPMPSGLPPSPSQRRGPLEAFFQQAASTGFALFILPGGPVVFWTLFLWLASSRCLALRALVLAYGVWMWCFDTARLSGERSSRSVRGWRVWRLLAAYFPASLHATAPLPPDATYVLGYHPHGVVSLGAFVGVGTNGVGLDDAFPGLNFHLCTLAVNFKMPFIRELILRLDVEAVVPLLHVGPRVQTPAPSEAQQTQRQHDLDAAVVDARRDGADEHRAHRELELPVVERRAEALVGPAQRRSPATTPAT